ncbi:hypothetical protein [Novosphingopyxis sp.]|uniref:hypothetical protein n=1 Tax=Novosphingopyxis sp. TaxID=2709690 RepID=UPI003B5B865C
MNARRTKVAELTLARKAVRHRLKRDFDTAKREIMPSVLVRQFKARKIEQVKRLGEDTATLAKANRNSIALGSFAALASGLIAYSMRRWKKQKRTKNLAEPAFLNRNFDGER